MPLPAAGGRRHKCLSVGGIPKTRHKTRAEAYAHRTLLISRGAYAPQMIVYRCQTCGFWHVGHSRRGKR